MVMLIKLDFEEVNSKVFSAEHYADKLVFL